MAEALSDIPPAEWQVTATTIECDMVKDYVTIMVNGDWSCKCTWWGRYINAAGQRGRRKLPPDIKAKTAVCQGPDCSYVTGYRDKLIGEEKAT